MITCSSCGEYGSHKFACDGVASWSGEAWHSWCFVKENAQADFTQVKLRPTNRAWQRSKTTAKLSRYSTGMTGPYARPVTTKPVNTQKVYMSTSALNA